MPKGPTAFNRSSALTQGAGAAPDVPDLRRRYRRQRIRACAIEFPDCSKVSRVSAPAQ